MELFLNLLWVVFALTLMCVWRFYWAVQLREREHPGWRQWTALACALVFLFFMVSITDDLHSELVVFEESSAGRRYANSVDCAHFPPQHHAAEPINAILGSMDSTRVFTLIGSVAPEHDALGLEFAPSRQSGRAPPVISL